MTGRRLPYFLILIPLSFLLYANTLGSSFIFDDSLYITENPLIRELENFRNLSGVRYVGLLSFALNYSVGGYEPLGYHVVSILIHGVNGILVYLFVSALLGSTSFSKYEEGFSGGTALAFGAALLFLVHPVQTQAVSYIAQRFVSLVTLFYLLTALLYIYSRRSTGMSKVIIYMVALVSALLAYKTKEISFTLPAALFVIEFGFLKGAGTAKRSILLILPFIVLSAIIPIETLMYDGGSVSDLSQGEMDAIRADKLKDLTELSPYSYLMTQFRVVVTYLRLLILPINQVLDYDFPRYDSFATPQVFLSFILLASIFGLGLYLFIRFRRSVDGKWGDRSKCALLLFSTGILWFFITVSIESSVIPIKDHIFEHRVYLPSIGFAMAAVVLIYVAGNYLSGTFAKVSAPWKYFWSILICVALALSASTVLRNRVWANNMTMWTDVVAKMPNNGRAHYNIAREYIFSEDYVRAKRHLLRTVELIPDHTVARNNLGNVYLVNGDIENARIQYEAALSANTYNYRAHYNLGLVYERLGRINEAHNMYSEALRLNPEFAEARQKIFEIERYYDR